MYQQQASKSHETATLAHHFPPPAFINSYSSSSSSSIHPRDISTALAHFLYILSLCFFAICGLKKCLPSELISLSSSNDDHTLTANPAAMAAPSAVVSRILGRSTGICIISACV